VADGKCKRILHADGEEHFSLTCGGVRDIFMHEPEVIFENKKESYGPLDTKDSPHNENDIAHLAGFPAGDVDVSPIRSDGGHSGIFRTGRRGLSHSPG
jgi:hypothetical protein